jgi:hypothetical protein
MHGNEALLERFGQCLGQPAREALVFLPPKAFALMDAVLDRGKPLATSIQFDDADWRLTVAPRVDPETAEVYGVTIYLRARTDPAVGVLRPAAARTGGPA